MCPRPQPLQTSVYLPHRPHWAQVSVQLCQHQLRPQGGASTLTHCARRCVCAAGYVGDDCSVDYNDCEDHRCQNGAHCVDELSGYSCVCRQGYR